MKEPAWVRKGKMAAKVVEEAGGQATTREVFEALNVSPPTAIRYCEWAVELGLLCKGIDRTQPPISPPHLSPATLWIRDET